MNARRPSASFVVVNTAFSWLSTAIAAVALWPIYQSTALIVLVGVALLVGSLLAILGAVLRWPSPVVLGAAILAFLAVGVPLAVPAKAWFAVLPTLDGLIDLIAGVALGWKQLLTITLPVGDYEALLVPALVTVLGATTLGLSVALRTRFTEAAVLAPIAVFGVAVAFGPQLTPRPLLVPIALLVVVLFWLVWLRWYRRRSAIRALDSGAGRVSDGAGLRTAVSATLILAVASAGGVAAVAAVPPTADRTVLRTGIEQAFDPRDLVSPLSGFRQFWRQPTRDAVLLRVSGLPDGARIRLATMDTYDGVVYSVGSAMVTSESGSFTRVPSSIDQSDVAGERIEVTFEIAAYEGIWLPTVGAFESIVFAGPDAAALRADFAYNDASGAAAVLSGVGTGDVYSLTAVLPEQPDPSALIELEPGSAVVPSPADPPQELTAKLDAYTRGVDGAGARLVAALDGLADEGYISHGVGEDEPPSRSGHSIDRIAELFGGTRMIGDAEQYAVAAALMADQLGFPARVVLGFVADGGQVRGADVAAWIEVNTVQYGWVSIDPTPPEREIPQELPEDNAQVARPQTIVPPVVVDDEPLDRQSAPDSEQELPPDLDPALQFVLAALRVLGWVSLVLAVALAPFLLVIAAKLRRRRLRRTAATPSERISGGWREFQDAVLDHGLTPATASTRNEIADVAGGPQSRVLAAVVDRASFAPERPDAEEADRVWRAVDELRAVLDSGLTRWQRMRARISVRSLGAYSVTKLFKR